MIFLNEFFYSLGISRIFIVVIFVVFYEYEVRRVLYHVSFFKQFIAHHIDHCKVGDVFEFKSNFIEVSLKILTDAAFLIVEEYKPRFITNDIIGIRVNNQDIII